MTYWWKYYFFCFMIFNIFNAGNMNVGVMQISYLMASNTYSSVINLFPRNKSWKRSFSHIQLSFRIRIQYKLSLVYIDILNYISLHFHFFAFFKNLYSIYIIGNAVFWWCIKYVPNLTLHLSKNKIEKYKKMKNCYLYLLKINIIH